MSEKNNYYNPMGQLDKDELKARIIFDTPDDAIKALCKKVFGAELKYKHEIIAELNEEEKP